MSLRSRILLLLSVVSLGGGLTTWAVQELVILPGFADAEQAAALEDVERCLDALARDSERLSVSAHDYASWDDTYQYMGDANTAYEEANFVPSLFTNTELHIMGAFENTGLFHRSSDQALAVSIHDV